MRRVCCFLFTTIGLLPLLALGTLSRAQTTPKVPRTSRTHHKLTRRAPAKSANIKTGQIVSLDAHEGNLAFKDETGVQQTYPLTDTIHCFKDKKAVDVTAFSSGDTVVLHLRRSRSDGTLQVREMEDPATAEWLDTLRHETTQATLQELKEDTLTATVGTESTPFTYTLSDKTQWSRAGKEATAADFKAGDTLYIVPRALPGGTILAHIVADSLSSATQTQERQSLTLHGVIKYINAITKTITLATLAGDTRFLQYNATTELRRGNKTLPLTLLHSGQNVTARIERDPQGTELVWRLTLQSMKGTRRATGKHPLIGARYPLRKTGPHPVPTP